MRKATPTNPRTGAEAPSECASQEDAEHPPRGPVAERLWRSRRDRPAYPLRLPPKRPRSADRSNEATPVRDDGHWTLAWGGVRLSRSQPGAVVPRMGAVREGGERRTRTRLPTA